MFKKLITLAVVIGIVVVGNRVSSELTEARYRALTREALQNDIAMGYAPMQATCGQIGMDFEVNDLGESVCYGVPSVEGKQMHEVEGIVHLANSCRIVDGLPAVDKMIETDAQLVVRCERTRFSDRWVASNR
jgi:hypothetical protein